MSKYIRDNQLNEYFSNEENLTNFSKKKVKKFKDIDDQRKNKIIKK